METDREGLGHMRHVRLREGRERGVCVGGGVGATCDQRSNSCETIILRSRP